MHRDRALLRRLQRHLGVPRRPRPAISARGAAREWARGATGLSALLHRQQGVPRGAARLPLRLGSAPEGAGRSFSLSLPLSRSLSLSLSSLSLSLSNTSLSASSQSNTSPPLPPRPPTSLGTYSICQSSCRGAAGGGRAAGRRATAREIARRSERFCRSPDTQRPRATSGARDGWDGRGGGGGRDMRRMQVLADLPDHDAAQPSPPRQRHLKERGLRILLISNRLLPGRNLTPPPCRGGGSVGERYGATLRRIVSGALKK